MSKRSQLLDHCLELLTPLGVVRARRMFGGHGLTINGLFIALIAFDRLYLKADELTRAQFAEAGCDPFVYRARGRPVTMSYWTVPAQALESPAGMRPWAQLAIEAALRSSRKPKRVARSAPGRR